jgi:hypothetical protein
VEATYSENALAYFDAELIVVVKSFIANALENFGQINFTSRQRKILF